MYAVAFFRMTWMLNRAIVNSVYPGIKPEIVRFAAEEIYVLLPHKEVRVVNRVRSIHTFVVMNRYRRCRLRADGGAGRAGKTYGERLVAFCVRVVDNRNRERFRPTFTWGEGHGPYRV